MHAADSEMALLMAKECFLRRREGEHMWVVKRSDIHSFQDESLLEIAADKSYRFNEGYREVIGIHLLGDADQGFVLLHPVADVAERGVGGGKGGILPAPRDPARHVDDAQGAERLDGVDARRGEEDEPVHAAAVRLVFAMARDGLRHELAGAIQKAVRRRRVVTVRGLTTAASLWVTAAIGLAVGLGYVEGALAVSVGALLVLYALGRLVRGDPPEIPFKDVSADLTTSFRSSSVGRLTTSSSR